MQEHIYFNQATRQLELLDQRYLPTKQEIFTCGDTQSTIYALQTMVVRGAPAIGVTAAFGCLLAAFEVQKLQQQDASLPWKKHLQEHLQNLSAARPTAVNLSWAVAKMQSIIVKHEGNLASLIPLLLEKAMHMQKQDISTNKLMGEHGAAVLKDGDTVMTHCNAGALATAGFGTALGVIYAAFNQGKKIKVIANETRPFLQGARLSAYELHKYGVPVHVACDNACAILMQKKMVQKVIVGADRIAANGDTANKIGTYGVALLAKAHNIPFYIAAPFSTIDMATETGLAIPIEERPSLEVSHVGDVQITPTGVPVYNFAFDITPSELITGIITERGILAAPYKESIAAAFACSQS